MVVAHLADLHLGYRAYHRMLPGGINVRERDVAQAFRAALDRLIELKPNLILIAGDVFHTVRPSNAAIADAFRQFARLRAALPGAPIVMVAGEHDSPRSVETGSILRLFAEIPGVHVMDQSARVIYFEELGASVLGVPHAAVHAGEQLALEPDVRAQVNVLMLHVDDVSQQKLEFVSEYGGAPFDLSALAAERWDYVALGHYHVATQVKQNVWYAGAIERTSANIWRETSDKGFLSFDTETRAVRFHALETRPVIDLPRFSARLDRAPAGRDQAPSTNGSSADPLYQDAKDIDARIRALMESVPGGIEGKIVRLIVHDLPRDLFRELDHRALREYRATALHFHLDARRPEPRHAGLIEGVGRRRTLEQEIEWYITEHWRPSSSDIEKSRLLDLAHLYLAETRSLGPSAEADEPPPLSAE
ncbi:MAG: metallophosphoesterase family protein [Longimicrobiales bacterium]